MLRPLGTGHRVNAALVVSASAGLVQNAVVLHTAQEGGQERGFSTNQFWGLSKPTLLSIVVSSLFIFGKSFF